jgi:hypothetical protein
VALLQLDDFVAADVLVMHERGDFAFERRAFIPHHGAELDREELLSGLAQELVVSFECARLRRECAVPEVDLPVVGDDRRLDVSKVRFV